MRRNKSHLSPVTALVEQEIGKLLESSLKAFKSGRTADVQQKLDQLVELHSAWSDALKLEEKLSKLLGSKAEAVEEAPQPVKAKESVKKAEPAAPEEDKEAIRKQNELEMAEARAQREERKKRKAFQDATRGFFESSKVLMSEDKWTPAQEALAKSLICEGRALEAEAVDADPGLRGTLANEIDIFGGKWDRAAGNKEFFALNLQRRHDAEIWRELGEAFKLLADAEEATAWLETKPDIAAPHFNYLFDAAAAAESIVDRVMIDFDLGVWDSQQRDIHARLEALRPEETKTKWWRRIGADIPERAEIINVARGLKAELHRIRQGANKTKAKETVVAELSEWLKNSVADEGFEERLLELVTQALEDGIPPSDKELRTMLGGYHFILATSDNKKVKKLNEHVKADTMLAQTKASDRSSEPEPEEVNSKELEELLPLTRGKTLMFVGGAKGQGWRKQDYVKALELNDLIWPDAEEQTKPSALATNIAKSDIVCLLIRFSRHSFKGVIDDAKAAGKMTAIMPRGLGLNTIIHELHSQLVSGPVTTASSDAGKVSLPHGLRHATNPG